MTKILAAGIGPLLEPGVKKIGGQCLRTWHFLKPLIDQGHEIRLFTIPIPDKDVDVTQLPLTVEKEHSGFSYTQINRHELKDIVPVLRQELKRFCPEALLGINSFPARVLSALDTDLPLWVDLNGYAMVEGQTKSRLYQTDEELPYFWEQELLTVQRADKFSVVSEPQKYALLGELAIAGRLNRWTFDYEFVHCVPNAVNEMYSKFPDSTEKRLRGVSVPEDAFVVLWSGGFNTWTDVDFLFQAVSRAMQVNPLIHFVSTGGTVDGHDEITYHRFQKLISESEFKSRFHLYGWIEAELIPFFYTESDLGINVDSFNYETIFGARNRLVNMMAMGLPVLTTLGTEISHIISQHRLGLTVPIGDTEGFADAIIASAAGKIPIAELGKNAREFVFKHFTYEATTGELQNWIAHPQCSPDNLQRYKQGIQYVNKIEALIGVLSSGELDALRQAKEELERIRSRPLFKIYRFLKRLLKPD
ncbi:glycosyltransferase [Candidatus Sumerlaeota bacterium]|nr:glycosyltransferase [Candidatus Sumerlaeota bacterium]